MNMKIEKPENGLRKIYLSIKETLCRNSFVRRVISAPKISLISDMGGKEDKAREQLMQSAEKGYREREEKNIKVPDWAKERREKSKQKRQWL